MALLVILCIFGVVFVAVPLGLTVALLVVASRSASVSIGQCIRCEYDLRGLRAGGCRCPECGHPFAHDAAGRVVSTHAALTC